MKQMINKWIYEVIIGILLAFNTLFSVRNDIRLSGLTCDYFSMTGKL